MTWRFKFQAANRGNYGHDYIYMKVLGKGARSRVS